MTKTEKIDLISSNFDGMQEDIGSIRSMLKESSAKGDKMAKNWKWQKWLLGPVWVIGFGSFAYLLTLIIK